MQKQTQNNQGQINFLEYLRELCDRYSHDKEAVDFINSCYSSIISYHNVVLKTRYNIENSVIKFRLSGEAYREFVKEQDLTRKLSHDSAIGSINIINRLAAKEGMPPISGNVNMEDRVSVGDFIGVMVTQIYEERENALNKDEKALYKQYDENLLKNNIK